MTTFGDRSTSWLIRTGIGVCGFFGQTTIRPISRRCFVRSITSVDMATGRRSVRQGSCFNGCHRIPADHLSPPSNQPSGAGRGLCSGRGCVEPLGYLAWAACGKDPGFSPLTILEQAGLSGRYATVELEGLSFDGPPPSLEDLLGKWHLMLTEARGIAGVLPAGRAGMGVLQCQGDLYRRDLAQLRRDLAGDGLVFHADSIRVAYPQIAR